jgi:hypothetical protein
MLGFFVAAGLFVLLSQVLRNSGAGQESDTGEAGQETQADYSGNTQMHSDPEDAFGFPYPKGLIASTNPVSEGQGKTIVLESKDPQKGFEIAILTFDEQGPLTAKRIQADIPDIRMDNLRSETVGGATALAFDSDDENIGAMHEVWFAYGGKLHEVRTYKAYGAEMESLLSKWMFKQASGIEIH